MVFLVFNSNAKTTSLLRDCCFLGVLGCDTVCWTKIKMNLDIQYCFTLVAVFLCLCIEGN